MPTIGSWEFIEWVGWELHLLASFIASLLLAAVQVRCTAREHEDYKMEHITVTLASRQTFSALWTKVHHIRH